MASIGGDQPAQAKGQANLERVFPQYLPQSQGQRLELDPVAFRARLDDFVDCETVLKLSKVDQVEFCWRRILGSTRDIGSHQVAEGAGNVILQRRDKVLATGFQLRESLEGLGATLGTQLRTR